MVDVFMRSGSPPRGFLSKLRGGESLLARAHAREEVMDLFQRSDYVTAAHATRVYQALEAFSETFERRSVGAQSALATLRGHGQIHEHQRAFGALLRELQRMRFVLEDEALEIITASVAVEEVFEKKAVFKAWSVDDSVWKARKNWCDGRALYEMDDLFEAAFRSDWSSATASPALALYKKESTSTDEAGGADALSELAEVMWKHFRLFLQLFDWYSMWWAGQVVPNNVFRIGKQAFKRLIEELGVIKKGSQTLTANTFEQVFLQVTAIQEKASSEGGEAVAPSLNRMESLQCLVRIADLVFLRTGEVGTLTQACDKLMSQNVARVVAKDFRFSTRPNLYGNAFRKLNCYEKGTSDAILENMTTLKSIFNQYCYSDKDGVDNELRTSMSFEEYNVFVRDFEICDHLFTPRDATLAFVWARLRVIDDGKSKRGRARLSNLSFECFFEVLCRIAMMKVLPTDMELGYAEQEDAANFFASLAAESSPTNDVLRKWRDEHREAWDVDWEDEDYDPRQPCNRAFAHLLELLVYTVESFYLESLGQLGGGGKGVKVAAYVPDVQLTAKKVEKFYLSKNRKRDF